MRENRWLTAEEFDRAMHEPVHLQPPSRTFRAPHFVDLVLAQLGNATTARTTLDLPLNERVESIVREQVAKFAEKNLRNASAVVIDNASGDVLALVGSENYFAPGTGQVNGAWSPRSAGSTIKPFTYLLALEHGATPASVAADVPALFDTPTGSYHPENYTRRCGGPVRYRDALANSLNIPAVRVLAAIGGPPVLHARLLDLGFTSLTKPVAEYGLGLTIGNAEVRLLELTNAYACLARLGNAKPYRLLATQPTSERAYFATPAPPGSSPTSSMTTPPAPRPSARIPRCASISRSRARPAPAPITATTGRWATRRSSRSACGREISTAAPCTASPA